jgi:TldD protein
MSQLRTDEYGSTVQAILDAARSRNVFAIARFQNHRAINITVARGILEQVQSTSFSGFAVQVFTEKGHMGFSSSNVISPESAVEQVRLAEKLARAAEELGGEAVTYRGMFSAQGVERIVPAQQFAFDAVPIDRMEQILKELNVKFGYDQRLSIRSSFGLFEDDWRVIRSDGRDVSFRIPRAFVYNVVTAAEGKKTATGRAAISGSGLELLLDPGYIAELEARTHQTGDLCIALLDAPKIKGGHYKIVIDYALAKGLAHEAFGHAAETDYMEESILGHEGRFKAGEAVAPPFVSIVDGPLEGDYAYQPISATGEVREQVPIIDHGVLHAALADAFSAKDAGVKPVGADRVESYLHIPCPRMSNIRLLIDNPLPIPEQDPGLLTPEGLRQLLDKNGLRAPGETVLFLTGYKGGQVNPSQGDFVFNCTGIYKLDDNGATLHQPAIFSGKVLSALKSIMAGIGPVQHDAMGTCGKRGQGVPSSGGSNSFIVIAANEAITIGGE